MARKEGEVIDSDNKKVTIKKILRYLSSIVIGIGVYFFVLYSQWFRRFVGVPADLGLGCQRLDQGLRENCESMFLTYAMFAALLGVIVFIILFPKETKYHKISCFILFLLVFLGLLLFLWSTYLSMLPVEWGNY